MFIVWGQKHQRLAYGYTGAFCVVCRDVTSWKVRRTQLVSHIYYIPAGSGTPLFDEITCECCGAMRQLRRDASDPVAIGARIRPHSPRRPPPTAGARPWLDSTSKCDFAPAPFRPRSERPSSQSLLSSSNTCSA
jgi:hypothetical protein